MGFVKCLLILNNIIIERPFVKSLCIYNCWTVIKKPFKNIFGEDHPIPPGSIYDIIVCILLV